MKKGILLVVLLTSMAVFAESNRVGLSSTLNLYNDVPAEIGLRIFVSEQLGFDLGYGMSISSEVKEDSASDTDKEEGQTNWSARVGLAIKAYQKNNVKLYFLGNFNILKEDYPYNYAQMYDRYHSSLGYKYFKTSRYYKTISLLAEPNYFFADNFSIYSLFGLGIHFSPNSVYADPTAVYVSIDDAVKTKERKDAKTNVSIVNPLFNLGLRFYF